MTKVEPNSFKDISAAASQAASQQYQEEREQARKRREILSLKETRQQTDSELRSILADLSDLSTRTTRRLDYTYYSLLTSFSALRAGIHSLHGLARSTHLLERRFSQSTAELATETSKALRGADEGFERQKGRIEDLEARLLAGRSRVEGLGRRLDTVQGKVERSARRDGEERRRAEGWWRAGWLMMVSVGVLMLAAWVWRGLDRPEAVWDTKASEASMGAGGLEKELAGLREETGVGNESLERLGRKGARDGKSSDAGSKAEATLRLFDEL